MLLYLYVKICRGKVQVNNIDTCIKEKKFLGKKWIGKKKSSKTSPSLHGQHWLVPGIYSRA